MTLRRSPQDEPAYGAAEVARMLALPVSTVKAWTFGHDYRHGDGTPQRFIKLIDVPDPRQRRLSFVNVCELHVLAAMRRGHRIPMPVVRDSLDFVARELGTERPLIARQFLTNGIDLFVQHAGKLLNTSQQGQQALRGDFQQALERIERGRDGLPVRLFPYSRTTATLSDQPSAIVIDPRLAFGRPALKRAGVTTEVIADRFRAGDSEDEMAGDYGVEPTEIREAIRFELEQRRAA